MRLVGLNTEYFNHAAMGAFFLLMSTLALLVIAGELIREGLHRVTNNPRFLPKVQKRGRAKL